MKNYRDIALSQKSDWEDRLRRKYIERTSVASPNLASGIIQVVMGPRRAGKSTFAEHLLANDGGYVNFDDERLSGVEDLDALLAAVDDVYRKPQRLLLDEIQNVPRWELWVNRLQRGGRQLVITGSNANLLGRELATHLTGRHHAIYLPPFSFSEVLALRFAEATSAEKASQLERYLSEGGYPEPLLLDIGRTEYMRDLVRSTLLKDIVRRYNVRSPGGIEDVAHYYFSNAAKEFSYRTVAAVARVKSSVTAEKYTRFLCESFLLFSVPRFSFKARERATINKKAYVVDPALAACLGLRPGNDTGRLAENVVAAHLWQRQFAGEIEFGFWKNEAHEEVDFVVRDRGKISMLIQVCWRMDSPATRSREYRALVKAGRELCCENLICLTAGEEGSEDFSWNGISGKIRKQRICDFLLQGLHSE
jgi:predicted AAA+ superfamily ATPase